MKIRILLIILSVAISVSANAQQRDTSVFIPSLNRLSVLGDSLLKSNSDTVRLHSHEKFSVLLDSILRDSAGMMLSFYQVKALSVINSDDNKIRLYNWMLTRNQGAAYSFFGYIRTYDSRKKKYNLISLTEKDYADNVEAETIRTDTNNWYGCVYYQVVHKRYKKKDYYLLLGWAPRSSMTTRKVIETLSVNGNRVTFGVPQLRTGGRPRLRMVFEYNSRISMSLRYDKNKDAVVFDHLASSDPRPESARMYHLYGPDFTYDGLEFRKGSWHIVRDLEMNNKDRNEGKSPELKKWRVPRKTE